MQDLRSPAELAGVLADPSLSAPENAMTANPLRLPVQVLSILLSALAMPTRPLTAQDLVPDGRVQVRQCPPAGVQGLCRTWQGAFQSLDGNNLILRESSGVLSSVAWTPTTRVKVPRGRHGYVGQGALLGLFLGIGVGAAAEAPRSEDCEPPCGIATPIGAVGGLALGALIGAVVRTDRWVVVEQPRAPGGRSVVSFSLSLPTRSTPAGIGLRYRF